MVVFHAGKCDLFPAMAGRKTGIVEIAFVARLREAEQRHEAQCVPRSVARGDEPDKAFKAFAGRGQNLRHAFGRRPAFLAIGGGALGFVKGRGIEARYFGQSRSRKVVALGQPVDGIPDLLVSQHMFPLVEERHLL